MTAKELTNIYDHHRGTAPLLRAGNPWRSALFLTLNLAAFAGVNLFWGYLATSRWVDFSPVVYYQGLITPVSAAFLHPLSVLNYPWMIPVVALLLGAIMFVPVITVVLYRSIFTVIFVALLLVLGRVPLLAVTLVIGCMIAARTPLRSDMPFFAFLLGLLPAGLYLYFFGLTGERTAQVLPLQRWVLGFPLLIAIVIAVLSAAISLGLGTLMRFRPGVILPVLAILLAGSIGIFYYRIGPGELDYALITEPLAPGDAIFRGVELETWRRRNDAVGLTPQTLRIRLNDDLQRLQHELIERCNRFLDRYGASERTASVLWIKGQAHSLQLDSPALSTGTVRYSASFASGVSASHWERIRANYQGYPQAALANWRLGELALRRGDITEAEELLHTAAGRLSSFLAARQRKSEAELEATIFRAAESLPPPAYYAEALFRVRRLIWLMESNDVSNDIPAAEALAARCNENPRELNYDERLGTLVTRYEKTRLGDNLKLDVALAINDPYTQ
ncbi:MAG: hypothetical protein ACYSTL_07140, partial [Planctomycetota bacterium]